MTHNRWLPVMVFALLVSVPTDKAWSDEVVLAADEWCPYNCVAGETLPGYVVEMASVIFEKAGHRLVYREMPWTRAVKAAERGEVSGLICATRDEVPNFIFADEPVGRDANSFVVRRGFAWRYGGLKDLQEVRIGIVQDYDYGEIQRHIDQYAGTDKVQAVSGRNAEHKNLEKLIKQRIDVVVGDIQVINHTARRMGIQAQIECAGTDGDYADLYVAFSPADPKAAEYAAILTEGIRELRGCGRLNAILAKYGLQDWQ